MLADRIDQRALVPGHRLGTEVSHTLWNLDLLAEAWQQATTAAQSAADRTADFVSKLGRSRVLGEKSLGVPDPGATSFCMLMRALGDADLFASETN